MSKRISIKEIDSKEIDKERTAKNKPSVVNISNTCFVPSEILADEFCQGFKEGVRMFGELTGLNPANIDYECELDPYIDYENKDNKKLEEIGDPNLRDLLLEHYIRINRNIVKIDPNTKETFKSKENIDTFNATRDLGEKVGEFCEVPLKLLSEKFCKGFEKGVNIVLKKTEFNKELFDIKCKSEDHKTERTKRIITYGILRKGE